MSTKPQRIFGELRQLGDAEGARRPARTYSTLEQAFPRHTDYAYAAVRYDKPWWRLDAYEWASVAALACALAWAIWG